MKKEKIVQKKKQKKQKREVFCYGKQGYTKDVVDDDAMQQQIHLPEDIFNLFPF